MLAQPAAKETARSCGWLVSNSLIFWLSAWYLVCNAALSTSWSTGSALVYDRPR